MLISSGKLVFKVFSKKIIKFRSKIAKSVVNENNSYNEYPNAKKKNLFFKKILAYSPNTLFTSAEKIVSILILHYSNNLFQQNFTVIKNSKKAEV